MTRHRTHLIALAGLFALGFWLAPVRSEDQKPPKRRADVNSLIKELMSLKLEDNYQCIALWMPFEAFVEIASQPDGSNRQAVADELDYLKYYQVMVAGAHIEANDGTRTYATQKELEQLSTLKLSSGEEFPLASTVPPKVLRLSEEFKRNFAANQGEFGQNMHVMIFSSKATDGKTLLTASMRDTLILDMKEGKRFSAARHEWRTPFDSLDPVSPCARCDQPLSTKWSFCPWCGAKLGRR